MTTDALNGLNNKDEFQTMPGKEELKLFFTHKVNATNPETGSSEA